jgi:hypothetical protein
MREKIQDTLFSCGTLFVHKLGNAGITPVIPDHLSSKAFLRVHYKSGNQMFEQQENFFIL